MSSKLQLDVRHLNRWWRHLVNAYEVRQAWCLWQVKLCDPCLSALKRFVNHARRIQVLGFRLYLYDPSISQFNLVYYEIHDLFVKKVQVAQLSQRDRAAGLINYGQKWKTVGRV